MKFDQSIKKLWARITESRWTIAYISFAVLQMVIAVSLEAIILQRNEVSHSTLEAYKIYDGVETPKIAYKNYTYAKYTMQFQSIKHGNIWFMVFQAFLVTLCISALFFQNTIDIISIAIINICLICAAGVQIYQSNKWITRVNMQIDSDKAHEIQGLDYYLSNNVVIWEIILLLALIVFDAASIFFGYKLYKQFGWNIYKKIGANIQMQRMYRTYLIFVLLLKLDFFLLICFQILNLVFLFNDPEEQTRNIIFQSIMVASVIPMVGLALWGVRRENIVAMFLFTVTSVITIANFLYILAEFIIKRDEFLLTFLDVLGILLSIMSMVVAYLAVLNFVQRRNHEGAINLETGGQGQRKRFSIDD
ncbi:5016_t:CDS:2 [Funneliformis caledonium]|uniref:5016_t:CDS:1 n=1 Tax=Funneliformis caledonium TaxID=1117310 RepID=A0A9N9H739_9GLOM|nr:5016_t:CDS:2 [Funneliformis caledonium]